MHARRLWRLRHHWHHGIFGVSGLSDVFDISGVPGVPSNPGTVSDRCFFFSKIKGLDLIYRVRAEGLSRE